MRPSFLATFALALTLALPLGGCAYLREAIGLGPQRPKVQLTDIAVTKATFLALDLAVTLRVDNPNNFDLRFSKLKYDMVAAGLDVARGVFDETVIVPATGFSLVKLPLRVDSQNALQLVQALLASKEEVFAELNATADFETPFGPMSVNFEDKQALKKLVGF